MDILVSKIKKKRGSSINHHSKVSSSDYSYTEAEFY